MKKNFRQRALQRGAGKQRDRGRGPKNPAATMTTIASPDAIQFLTDIAGIYALAHFAKLPPDAVMRLARERMKKYTAPPPEVKA